MPRPHLLLVLPLLMAACAHVPSPQDREAARIRYDLGVEATRAGQIHEAVREFQSAVEKDPDFAEAHNALGLLYHLSLGRPDKAEGAYRRALELRPGFSEAANNLGALYLDLGRFSQAETRFRQTLEDVLYPTPHVARGNLGWALWKQGRAEEALTELKAAVLTQPRFCQGYRNLGTIYRELGRELEAADAFRRFVDACPERGEAQLEWGRVLVRQGDGDGAAEAFERCLSLAGAGAVGAACEAELEAIGGPDGGGV